MSDRNGNSKWLVTTALTVGAMLAGMGIGWGTNSLAVADAREDIKLIQAAQKADHDCVIEVKTKLVAIESALLEIKTMLKEKN